MIIGPQPCNFYISLLRAIWPVFKLARGCLMDELFPLDHFFNIPQCSIHNMPKTKDLTPGSSPPKPTHGAFDVEELNSINKKIMELLKDQIAEVKYNTFFSNTFSLVSLTTDSIRFAATTEYIRTMIQLFGSYPRCYSTGVG